MKLEEAIEILRLIEEDSIRLNEPRSTSALRLGIEALKEVKRLRTIFDLPVRKTLPGETE